MYVDTDINALKVLIFSGSISKIFDTKSIRCEAFQYRYSLNRCICLHCLVLLTVQVIVNSVFSFLGLFFFLLGLLSKGGMIKYD